MKLIKEIIKKKCPNFVMKIKNYKNSKVLNYKIRRGELYDLEILKNFNLRKNNHPNPLTKFGKKCYSQTDEDGITLEIVKRMGLKNSYFAELGVGTGIENNTLVLSALGWKGFWIGGENLDINLKNSKKLFFIKQWVTRENVIKLFKDGLSKINQKNLDLISLDLDGNDLHLCKELLSNNICPSIFIVEYNAKFPPPINFTIEYNSQHKWNRDDYMGASLSSFNKVFEENNYKLICCNAATGANAFFVKKEYIHLFPEVPKEIEKIYVEPNYFLPMTYGQHPISIKTINQIVND